MLILAACAEEAVEPAAATAPSAAPLSAAPPVPDRGVPDAQSPDARVADATPADAAPTDAAAPEADAAAGGFRIIAGAAIVEEEATRPKAPVRKSLPVMKRPKPVAPPTAAPAPVAPAAPRLSPMQVIRNHNGDVHTCYARVALKDPTVRGRITVQWTIGKDGMPMAVAITQDTLKDKSVGACLKERARQWRFAPPGGGVQVISYPFDLSVQ
ncbi:MAG: AgmX/PglI C-terminal domain-containing protein [Myxococcales bacterium]|nr:AgmX/PglI C-terminal domain-containing protein [Myxococcales bacterium]